MTTHGLEAVARSGVPEVIGEIAGMRERLAAARLAGATVALVPTMGALHNGHLSLVRRAGELADIVVVSIFVNPLQFGPSEDLGRYPRTLDTDLAALHSVADLVFAPSVSEMYPTGPTSTRVTAGAVGELYEGASRPGHFDGMLTVVAKLLNIVQPRWALFGQKDAQQVYLVKGMVDDLNLPVTIEVVPTVREADGLALSSRNRFLDPDARHAARALSAALSAARESASAGMAAALAAAREQIAAEPDVKLDYLVVVDPDTLLPVDDGYRGAASLLVAARVGETRLIDNDALLLG